MEAFRELLDQWLARTSTSQAELSRRSGVPQNVISRWLGSSPPRPSDANLRKLAPIIGADYEDLLRMCGYLPGTPKLDADPVRTELDARLAKLGDTLSKYPRAFWLAVVEASERLAEAGDALQGPVSDPVQHRVSASDEARNGDDPPEGGSLAVF